MVAKYIKWTFIAVISFVFIYLGTVWVWANLTARQLLLEVSHASLVTALDPKFAAALTKIEDPSFYDHSGLNISSGQGLTTITSVVARMVFLADHQLDGVRGDFQSFYRGVFSCCKRIDVGRDIMALVLDSHSAKLDQLNIFLNNAYLGTFNGKATVGFDAAAVAYYGKELAELTEDEFYGLVAMLIAPDHYHPFKNPDIHAERVKRVRAVATGLCEPEGWRDLTYEHCATDA